MSDVTDAKPSLRGKIHLAAIVPAIVGSICLALHSQPSRFVSVLVYGTALILLFSVSAIYHTPNWAPDIRSKLRRLDHSMIYIFIAGTYTPFCIALGGEAETLLLPIVWAGAGLGVLKSLLWINAPRFVTALLFVSLGWAIVVSIGDFYRNLGLLILGLLGAGGLMYTLGAFAYARKAPNPIPKVFGYHEIFHSLVVLAAVCHYTALWITVA